MKEAGKCVPLLRGTTITVPEAAKWVEMSEDTVRRRAREFGLGSQPGGKGKQMRISYPALGAFVAGDEVALEAMRRGCFNDPSVKPYLVGRFEAGARS